MTMTCPSSSSLGLLLLLIAGAAAGPELDRNPPGACQEHANLHSRLDLVEKRVEDTVGTLEVELASLLEAIEAPKWRPLLGKPGEETVDDVLEEARREVRSALEEALMSA
ncbi:placenta-specific protein 9-like [Takifugu flavidus]|uniref:placenta-specific protein 9-like n=1 Tax=Takifugu flavidus TaxID=433684 RepID=UPI00254470BB|nr:placenta-specific protein 9-like [Takifugu flavidus]